MEFQVGDTIVGEITGIQPYGAFIIFPNYEQGLIHISEISPYFVKNVADYVHVGQHVRVKIIDILEDKKLYRLSLKQVADRRRQNIKKMTSIGEKRKKIVISQFDFEPLRQKLGEWVNIEINLINEENTKK